MEIKDIDDRITTALKRGLTDEQLERILHAIECTPDSPKSADPNDTRIIGTPVEVTERHIGCLIKYEGSSKNGNNDVLWERDGKQWETAAWFSRNPLFPNPYPVPITHQWFGGECPVDEDAMVLVQLEDGSYIMHTAEKLTWEHGGIYGDIIGYTVLDVRGLE